MGKHQQAFAEFMERLKKTVYESRIKKENNEEFLKRLAKNTKQSRQENEKAMGSSDTGIYVDMALEHEKKLKKTRAERRVSKGVYVDMALAPKRKLNENAHNAGARRARRADVSKRADAEASRARRAKTPMKAYKVGTNFGRKKPKMNRIIEL